MSKFIVLAIVLISVGACSLQPSDSDEPGIQQVDGGCVNPHESSERKALLENGIRSQVRFEGESEDLHSITDKMSEYDIHALSLAVISQGSIEWSYTFQNAEFPDEQQLNCDSLFQAASLSKPVAMLAGVRMQSAGDIDWDQDIQSYLKDFELPQGEQTPEHPVTFRNIFSHTSGISPGGYEGYANDLAMPSDTDILEGGPGVNTPAIAVIAEPNSMLAYSGSAYTLAELALHDIYSDSFSSIMNRWMLEPAGMEHSDFSQPLPASKLDLVARGHTQSGDVVAGGWRNYPQQAAAGLWSNANDMAKFLMEIYKGYHGESALFSQDEIQALINQERDGLVYGFILNLSGGGVSITHYGGNTGYRAGMTIDLVTGNGLVYLINSDNGGSLGSELLLSAAQIYGWRHFQQTTATRAQADPVVLADLAGIYKWNNQIDLTVSFDDSNDLISLFFPNGDEYKLTPIVGDDLSLIHSKTGVQVSFYEEDGIQSFRLYGQTAVKTGDEGIVPTAADTPVH